MVHRQRLVANRMAIRKSAVNIQDFADRNLDKQSCLRKLDRSFVQNLARRQYLYDMFGCLPPFSGCGSSAS
jgi:hypothetical protein